MESEHINCIGIKNDFCEAIDPKKPPPSPVIHVRGLAPQVKEDDLRLLLRNYGNINYILLIPQSNQALIEFNDVYSAIKLIKDTLPPHKPLFLHGLPCYFNFSTSQNIQRPKDDHVPSSKILMFTIINAKYPITVDILTKICEPYGKVYKIVIFHKSELHALVQFKDEVIAQHVKQNLHGCDIYADCCTIKIEYAKTNELNVPKNDSLSFDYTHNMLSLMQAEPLYNHGILPNPVYAMTPYVPKIPPSPAIDLHPSYVYEPTNYKPLYDRYPEKTYAWHDRAPLKDVYSPPAHVKYHAPPPPFYREEKPIYRDRLDYPREGSRRATPPRNGGGEAGVEFHPYYRRYYEEYLASTGSVSTAKAAASAAALAALSLERGSASGGQPPTPPSGSGLLPLPPISVFDRLGGGGASSILGMPPPGTLPNSYYPPPPNHYPLNNGGVLQPSVHYNDFTKRARTVQVEYGVPLMNQATPGAPYLLASPQPQAAGGGSKLQPLMSLSLPQHKSSTQLISLERKGVVDKALNGTADRTVLRVIMVYGIDSGHLNCDRLFNLFSVYAVVNKIKFLKSKEGCAMVEVKDGACLARIITHVNTLPALVWDGFTTRLSVAVSKSAVSLGTVSSFGSGGGIRVPSNPASCFNLPDGTVSYRDDFQSKDVSCLMATEKGLGDVKGLSRSKSNGALCEIKIPAEIMALMVCLEPPKSFVWDHSPCNKLMLCNLPPGYSRSDVKQRFRVLGVPEPSEVSSFDLATHKISSTSADAGIALEGVKVVTDVPCEYAIAEFDTTANALKAITLANYTIMPPHLINGNESDSTQPAPTLYYLMKIFFWMSETQNIETLDKHYSFPRGSKRKH